MLRPVIERVVERALAAADVPIPLAYAWSSGKTSIHQLLLMLIVLSADINHHRAARKLEERCMCLAYVDEMRSHRGRRLC
jgi:hypothetical protein